MEQMFEVKDCVLSTCVSSTYYSTLHNVDSLEVLVRE